MPKLRTLLETFWRDTIGKRYVEAAWGTLCDSCNTPIQKGQQFKFIAGKKVCEKCIGGLIGDIKDVLAEHGHTLPEPTQE